MKIRSPSMVEMHAFLAVCRAKSFKGAALQLCVTQAAVSKAVQRLEEHLGGVRLFDRNSTGAVLTLRGAELAKLIQRPILALESTFDSFSNTLQSRPVRISVIPTLGIQWLLPRLPQFRQLFPEVGIEMRQFRHDEDFTREDVDFWIEVKRPQRRWPDHVQTRYLLGRELVPVCTPELKQRFRHPEDLQSATLLGHTNFPNNWAQWFDAAGVSSTAQLGPSFDLTMNLIVAAKSGMGVAVVPACLVELELSKGELVKPFGMEVSCGRGYFLCRKKDSPSFLAGDRFCEWLIKQSKSEHLARSG